MFEIYEFLKLVPLNTPLSRLAFYILIFDKSNPEKVYPIAFNKVIALLGPSKSLNPSCFDKFTTWIQTLIHYLYNVIYSLLFSNLLVVSDI